MCPVAKEWHRHDVCDGGMVGRTGWKVQLSVQLGSGGMLFGRQ